MFADAENSAVRFRAGDYKIVALSLLGGALEVYDFIIFLFLASTIADVFFPPSIPQWLRLLQTMIFFSVGYLARPLGGIILAHFADKVGRKVMFNITLLLIAMPCLLIGVLPGYAQIGLWAPLLLLLARLIQGAALGGEVPNAWVFVAEHAPRQHQGYALGLLQAGLTLGYLLAAVTAALMSHYYTPTAIHQWAWRLPFLLGGVFGFIAIWLRQWLRETPAFLAMQHQRQAAPRLPLAELVRHHRHVAVPAALLTMLLTAAVNTVIVVTPNALQSQFGLAVSTTFTMSCVAILCLNIGCVIAGKLVDRFGPWRIVACYSVGLALSGGLLTWALDKSMPVLLVSYAVAGLLCGIISAVPAVIVQLFPTALKVSGISLVYNIIYSLCSCIFPAGLLAVLHYQRWGMAGFALLMMLIGLLTYRYYRTLTVSHAS